MAVVCDLPEEGWESMDFTGAMVLRSLAERHADTIARGTLLPAVSLTAHALAGDWPPRRGAERRSLVQPFL